ncbi:FeoB-associated Cys-rich membrane protein [Agathobaculum desmolans]|uniref:FeoB-associated Cys-rich membrane protein n=1 Tax=Agathobaculum desmolans TaxID=39484 RepID=UPI000A6E9867|nr:FeoB-associated Cys-rich membrane protein [Agathobaculum desmolans]
MATWIVASLLAVVLGLAVRSMVRRSKSGGCSGGCAGCSGCGCHHKAPPQTKK